MSTPRKIKLMEIYNSVEAEVEDVDANYISKLIKATVNEINELRVRESALRRMHYLKSKGEQ